MLPLNSDPSVFRQHVSQHPIAVARRKGISWTTLLLAITAVSIFCLLYAEGRSFLFAVSCGLLAILCTCFVFAEQPGETLTPAKVASLLYATSFAIAPLWLADAGGYRVRYFGLDVERLLGDTAVMVLAGYLALLLGYFLVARIGASTRLRDMTISGRQSRYIIACTLMMTALGLVSYIGLIMNSGGFGRLLAYVGGRADMFAGVYGGWFWGMHLLFAAYGLFALLAMPKHPWWCLVLALVLAAAFMPLQGRDIVVAPIFCWLLFFHALRKPLRWRVVVAGASAIVLLSALLGAFRSGDIRDDAGNFLNAFVERAGLHLTKVVTQNIEQLDTAMAAVRYVETKRQTIGPMVLMSWVEPVDRALFGDVIPSIYSGVFIDLLLTPEHKGWNTAASPSLPGELYIGLGWFGVVAGMALYGATLGLLMRWHDARHRNPVLFAAYPFVVYIAAKMIVDGSAHAFRPIIVFVAVAACALFAPAGVVNDRRERNHV